MKSKAPFLGILCWEEGGNPKGLEQLENLVGNSVNPATYPFPVVFRRVPGANYHSVVHAPHRGLIDAMVRDGEKMVAQGARAIITSCGFNALFQNELSEALPVPVFTSALMQIPCILASLGGQKLAVITASKATLTAEHFRTVGVTDMQGIAIYGMDEMSEWSKIQRTPEQPLSLRKVAAEVISLGVTAKKEHPGLGAILLECTDLPPFANGLREEVRLPVYDLLTLVLQIRSSFSR